MTTHSESPRHHWRDLLIAVMIGATVLAVTLNLERLGIFKLAHGTVFEQVFGKPAPASVHVINTSTWSHWSGTKYIWMHFRISPVDLEALLKSEPYTDHESSGDFSDYEPPSWWSTDSMGSEKRVYSREIAPQLGRHRSARDIVVSRTRNEVFVLMRNWYEP